MKPLILVVNDFADCGESYGRPFTIFGECVSDPKVLEQRPDDVVLVVFTGGADVTPAVYGEEANPKTGNNPPRDKFESKVFDRSVELKKNIAGICRGAQFICALSGGKLVQHITGHGGYHNLKTDDDRTIKVTSTHHQMQLPPDNAVPIAWADPSRSSCYEGPPGVQYEPDREHDVVWYPETNALGMQYHPEYMDKKSDGFLYSQELMRRFFNLKDAA